MKINIRLNYALKFMILKFVRKIADLQYGLYFSQRQFFVYLVCVFYKHGYFSLSSLVLTVLPNLVQY